MSSTPRKGLVGGLLLLTGAIVGVAGTLFYLESQPKRPSRVLAEVKAEFAKQGPIEGSWIHYVPVEYPELESQPQVYIGGISRYEGAIGSLPVCLRYLHRSNSRPLPRRRLT